MSLCAPTVRAAARALARRCRPTRTVPPPALYSTTTNNTDDKDDTARHAPPPASAPASAPAPAPEQPASQTVAPSETREAETLEAETLEAQFPHALNTDGLDPDEESDMVDMWNKDAPAGPEWGGPKEYEPTRFGDWATRGRVSDF